MPGYQFICYSKADARDFALKLANGLTLGNPAVEVWLDDLNLRPGRDWDVQIPEAIAGCSTLLFVMTHDSVADVSSCKPEWTWARQCKKPIIPILLHDDARQPFLLGTRQWLAFDGEFEQALIKLRRHLAWMSSPEGVLQTLKDRLQDAVRDLPRADGPTKKERIETDIEELKMQIESQQRIVDDPQDAKRRSDERIDCGLERERRPERPTGALYGKFINPPPGSAPTYFQDRHESTESIGNFLKDEALRMITIVGRGGIGKTVLVCRLLKALETGRLPDCDEPLPIDGIVYLSPDNSRKVTLDNIYTDLCKLLPPETAEKLETLYKTAQVDTETKMAALLREFARGRTVLLLDSFEDAIDPLTRTIRDRELFQALKAVLTLPPHGIKVILTTRIAPKDLAVEGPGRQVPLDLDEGLPSPYAENILREMDADGKLGLKTAPAELLDQARLRTRGYPRALEALFAILSADRDTSLNDILASAETSLPENVVEVLVGEAFKRLDVSARQVMQALAVYARPVPSVAVDYLLRPWLSVVDSGPILKRLVNMKFVRKEGVRYYLHPVDREYAFRQILVGSREDCGATDPPYTQFALQNLAADYFRQTRKPRGDWRTIDDLTPQLGEFDLRCATEHYDQAAEILCVISYAYLYKWGYFHRMIELHEKLHGKTIDPKLNELVLGFLGDAYAEIGQIEKAFDVTQKALLAARRNRNQSGEILWLGNLGTYYRDLGDTPRALQLYEEAAAINRNDGKSYLRVVNLIYQAECFIDLGQRQTAIDHLREAIGIPISQDPQRIGVGHGTLGLVFFDEGRYDEAITEAIQAVQIGQKESNPRCICLGNVVHCLASLAVGDLATARRAAEDAEKCDQPLQNYLVRTLLGIVALRQGRHSEAQAVLANAVADAKSMLKFNRHCFRALDCLGLAYATANCGIAKPDLGLAIEAHRNARQINRDAGVVARVMRFYDMLQPVDVVGLLAHVRLAAAGQ